MRGLPALICARFNLILPRVFGTSWPSMGDGIELMPSHWALLWRRMLMIRLLIESCESDMFRRTFACIRWRTA